METRLGRGSFLGNPVVNRQLIPESRIIAKNIVEDHDLKQGYRLRHRVFAGELGWVPKSKDNLEIDAYDAHAEHFGVFNDGNLLSYLRLVLPNDRFMIEKEFACMVSGSHKIRKSMDTCEVSRLCVSIDERSTKVHTDVGLVGVSLLLYREVYRWSLEFGVRHLYLVVERKVFRLLNMMGFPCQLVGDPVKMPDGVVAVAAIMDWREFEERNYRKRPDLINWFSQSQSYRDGLQRPLPGHGLQLPAFS